MGIIDLGLSEEYLQGYNARLKNLPFDDSQPEEWKDGWKNANWRKKWEKEIETTNS